MRFVSTVCRKNVKKFYINFSLPWFNCCRLLQMKFNSLFFMRLLDIGMKLAFTRAKGQLIARREIIPTDKRLGPLRAFPD